MKIKLHACGLNVVYEQRAYKWNLILMQSHHPQDKQEIRISNLTVSFVSEIITVNWLDAVDGCVYVYGTEHKNNAKSLFLQFFFFLSFASILCSVYGDTMCVAFMLFDEHLK